MAETDTEGAQPRVHFMLGGTQKGGTTALARYLALHPALALPACKEAHVFDAVDFDESWTCAQVDQRFDPYFPDDVGDRICGDATPITMLHPTLIARAARYNPGMRWVILLRDPVERAISQYFMERSRGHEARSLLVAVLRERWRLAGHWNDWSTDSPLRVASYAARGRYARQLEVLFAHFPATQVLLLRSADLGCDTPAVLAQVWRFLGVEPLQALPTPDARVFAGQYRPPSRLAPGRLALRWLLRGEIDRLRTGYGIDLG